MANAEDLLLVAFVENQHYFEKGLWQQTNIGQYSSQIRTLFRFPWIRKKADAVYLSVYQLHKTANEEFRPQSVDGQVVP